MDKLVTLIKRYKHYLVVFGFTILGHGLGFGREVAIAYQFGASSVSDGLLIGLTPLYIYYSIFGVAYANAAMARIKTADNHQAIEASLPPLLISALVIGMGLWFFNESLVRLFGPGLSGEGLVLANQLVALTALSAGISSLFFWFRGIRYLEQKFTRVSVSELMPNIGTFIGIFVLFQLYGLWGLAIGITLGYFIQLLFVVESSRVKLNRKAFASLWSEDQRIIYRNTILSVLGISGVMVDVFVDRYFASQLAEGTVASINFANKVMTLPLHTLVFAIITVMFPKLIALRDSPGPFGRVRNKVNWMLIAMCLSCVPFAWWLGHDIIALLFQYGEFDAEDVAQTAPIMQTYAFGLVFSALVMFNAKVRYAQEDFKTPLYAGLVGMVINVTLDYILVGPYGAIGLAAATGVAAAVNAAILILAPTRTPKVAKPPKANDSQTQTAEG